MILHIIGENPSESIELNKRYLADISQVEYTVIPVWTPSGPSARREYFESSCMMSYLLCYSYNKAREIKSAQDAYCAKVEEGRFDEVAHTAFPQDLQWEALVDVLRGRVKVQVHCYETVDLDDVVRVGYQAKSRLEPHITRGAV